MSICSIKDVAANTSAPFWFQVYVMEASVTRCLEIIRNALDVSSTRALAQSPARFHAGCGGASSELAACWSRADVGTVIWA